jgi:glycosyltransferase involved in cell wall biosynthesis
MSISSLVINATAIGAAPDGIGVYGLQLLRALFARPARFPVRVVLNEAARPHFGGQTIPVGITVQWVSGKMSPDRGTRGNLRRWLYANALSLRHRESLLFAISQIEAPLVGGRRCVMVHDTIPLLFPRHHPRQHHFYRRYLGAALARASGIVTPSRATRDEVCRWWRLDRARIRVIRHGSPVPLAGDGPRPARERIILWIGRGSPIKNLSTLTDAFRTIEHETGARLVLAGAGVSFGQGMTGTSEAGVTVLGPVTEAEKIALLDRASVLVCPSLHEGFGFPALEAMARGCPVVAARAGGLPEVCGTAATYVDPADPASIAQGIRAVLKDETLRLQLTAEGTRRARSFRWDACLDSHVAAWEAAVAERLDGARVRRPATASSEQTSEAAP